MTGSAPPTAEDPSKYRLPTDVKPTHYDLTIRTDLENLKFDGFVIVHLNIVKDTSTIEFNVNVTELHLGELILSSPALETSSVHPASDLKIDAKQERAILALSSTLPAGTTATMKVGFEGPLAASMLGYYRSAWEHEGQTKHYSVTQFGPTAARRVFPCWDEPLLKATFTVVLVSRENMVPLSNMPSVNEEIHSPDSKDESDTASWLTATLAAAPDTDTVPWKITTFAMTPPMSTYIVVFANGPFTFIEDSYKSPLSGKSRPLRVYTTPDLIHQARFALDVMRDVLPHYERVFDIEYPLPKLDTLVVTDSDVSAMENWGLITGRTSAFLLDPKKADLSARKHVAAVQSHEVAHMWFGNITTMAWWDTVYLNEGFASLMGEIIILDKLFPEWNLHAEFISGRLNNALNLDAKLSSHPIEVECPDANMINQIFDALSYSKAASVLRMLSRYVGEERFLKGVSLYLKDHRFGNSVSEDLWAGVGKATGIDIPKMMDNWVKKIGFPVVTVKDVEGGIHVRQDRFLETGAAPVEHNETIWTIPLSILTVSTDGKAVIDSGVVLDTREKTILLDTSKPYKLNAGSIGVYRVLYANDRLEKIADEAAKKASVFSLEDRIGLLNDAPALAKAGCIKTSGVLSLIYKLREASEFLVVDSMAGSLESIISTWWEHEDITEKLNLIRRQIFAPIVKRLGYEYPDGESVDDRQLRTRAITAAAFAGDKDVVKELTDRFAYFMKTGDNSNIPADLERMAIWMAVQHGGRAEYDAVKAIAIKPPTPSAGISAMIGLGLAQSDELADETLNYLLNDVRDQDLIFVFAGFRLNPKFVKYGCQKFRDNYDVLAKRLSGTMTLQRIVQHIHETLSSKADHEDACNFFNTKDTSKFSMALQQTYDTILARAAWIARSTADIKEWLDANALE
ncbi:Aminopeptidase 2 mitochondrial [Steccherinum ochraceum]|uniref:Aminopeptidase n=1 Tax=Steccherinum ochraceum TaxID=92696 RepID=A0A4V2MWP3_9APHY|nr:Aminopeptidase 2 mitochondrial [Steccherinum ochraceum]